jgi:hypothetical protein
MLFDIVAAQLPAAGRCAEGLAGAQIKFSEVDRANDTPSFHKAFRQRRGCVGALVVRRQECAILLHDHNCAD